MRYSTSRILTGAMLFLLFFSCNARGAADNQVLQATLKNGLRVVIVRNTLAPVVTTRLTYLAGSNEAPDGFPGMAHAQEHMMFRGSKGLSAEQLASLTAAMGGRSNAFTRQSVTQYYFTVPADELETVLRIEAIRMKNTLDTEELWAKERGAIRSGNRRRHRSGTGPSSGQEAFWGNPFTSPAPKAGGKAPATQAGTYTA